MGHSIYYEMLIQENKCHRKECPYCRKGFCVLDADASVDEALPCDEELLDG